MPMSESQVLSLTQTSTAGALTRIQFPAHRLMTFHGYNSSTGASQDAFLKYYFGAEEDLDLATATPDQFLVLPPQGITTIDLNAVLPAGFGLLGSDKIGDALPSADVHVLIIFREFS